MPEEKPIAQAAEPASVPVAVAEAPPPPSGGRRGHRRSRTDLTTGSVPKKLFTQAWPQVVEGVVDISDQFIDLFWASRLPSGFRAIASIGVAQTFTQFGGQARRGFDEALRAFVARAVGAGDIRLANHVLFQGLLVTGVYCLVMVAVGFLLTDFFLNVIGVTDELRSETAWYMRIQFAGMATQGFRMTTGHALQASGEVIAPMRATMVTRLAHIALSPFLMFGWGWFPQMGLAGSALASVLAQTLGIGINLYALASGQSRLTLTLKDRPDLPLIWRMLKVGAPASIRGTERATAQLALLAIAAPFGTVALAAYALTRRLEQFTNFGSGGIGQASGVMVGQNLGAKQPERAKKAVAWALLYVGTMKSFILVLFWLFPLVAITFFTRDPAVVDLTVQWVRIQLFGAVFQGLMQVFQQSFMGAGDTLAPMIVTLVGVWVFEVPLAWFLCTQTGLGALGIAFASLAGFGSRVLFFAPYYFHGRWLRIKLI
jgi:putative MATE family efflux protein